MKTRPKISCVGEVLVDFLSTKRGTTLSGTSGFVKTAGGAAANVAVGIAKQGIRSAFIGVTGNDPFGQFLRDRLRRERVDISGLRLMKEWKTRLAFVSFTQSGERKFEFWERDPADVHLSDTDIDMNELFRSEIVHISSFLLLQDPSRSTAFSVAKQLKRNGCTVSFDPNLRPALWSSQETARKIHIDMIRQCAILKLNETEALFLTKTKNLSSAIKKLSAIGPDIIVVTMGKTGCLCWSQGGIVLVPGFAVHTVDTTGCGDAFLASLLCGIVRSKKQSNKLSLSELTQICLIANAAGAITSMRSGAIDALPRYAEIIKFLKSHHS